MTTPTHDAIIAAVREYGAAWIAYRRESARGNPKTYLDFDEATRAASRAFSAATDKLNYIAEALAGDRCGTLPGKPPAPPLPRGEPALVTESAQPSSAAEASMSPGADPARIREGR